MFNWIIAIVLLFIGLVVAVIMAPFIFIKEMIEDLKK